MTIRVVAAGLVGAGLLTAGIGSAGLGTPRLGTAGLGTPGIGSAGLGTAGLGTAGLGSAGLAGPVLLAGADSTPPGRQVFPAAASPDIAVVSDLVFEVARIQFGLANLDGTLIVTDGSRFRLAADVLFRFDSATLTPRASSMLADVADDVRRAKARSIRVDGYTDAAGDEGYNLALSRRRAAAVVTVLHQALGSAVSIRAAGHGEADPVADNDTSAGQARNRRVTVTITA